jgi:predicted phosphodiesterase/transposase
VQDYFLDNIQWRINMELGEDKSFDKYREVVEFLVHQGENIKSIAKRFNIHESKAQRWVSKVKSDKSVSEEIDTNVANVALAKAKQKLQDKNRISTKVFRESTRVENAVAEYSRELVEIFNSKSLSKLTKKHKVSKKNKSVAVIQLSDLHFNELVDVKGNKFDFNIAGQRLKMYADKVKQHLKTYNIKNVLIAMTGDLMNSDRRLDELLAMATNRSNATFLGVDLLQQFILDINKEYNISIAYVSGNESRIPKDVGWTSIVASDNYDTTIFNTLEFLFRGSKGITFVHGDPVEVVVEVAGMNVLLLHGNGSIKAKIEDSVQQIVGRYSQKGIAVDYVIFGHKHSTCVGDNYGRSSSLVGANAYSEGALNCSSRASQNLYIFHEDKNRDAIKVDLQYVGDYEGYEVKELEDVYNSKSVSKISKDSVVFKVVI